MFNKARKVLVDSFVGAIAVGWIFAQGVLDLVEAVSAPLANWATLRYLGSFSFPTARRASTGFPWEVVATPLFRGVALITLGYVFLRWLYYRRDELPEFVGGDVSRGLASDRNGSPTAT